MFVCVDTVPLYALPLCVSVRLVQLLSVLSESLRHGRHVVSRL